MNSRLSHTHPPSLSLSLSLAQALGFKGASKMRTVSDYILALGMLITGSINTLTTKLADTERSEGVKGDKHLFKHPFFQVISQK